MYEYIFFFALLLYASYYDWKHRAMPDWLNGIIWIYLGLFIQNALQTAVLLFGAFMILNWFIYVRSKNRFCFGWADILATSPIVAVIMQGAKSQYAIYAFALSFVILLVLVKEDRKPFIPLLILPYVISFI